MPGLRKHFIWYALVDGVGWGNSWELWAKLIDDQDSRLKTQDLHDEIYLWVEDG
jgi:hypothetical protein